MTFFKYVVIQVLAYIIDMTSFLLVLNLEITGAIGANIFSKLAAGSFAFWMHRSFTFNSVKTGMVGSQGAKYFFLLAIMVLIASMTLSLIFMWLPIPIVAKFISDIILVGLSYSLAKYFIFYTPVTNSDTAEVSEKT